MLRTFGLTVTAILIATTTWAADADQNVECVQAHVTASGFKTTIDGLFGPGSVRALEAYKAPTAHRAEKSWLPKLTLENSKRVCQRLAGRDLLVEPSSGEWFTPGPGLYELKIQLDGSIPVGDVRIAWKNGDEFRPADKNTPNWFANPGPGEIVAQLPPGTTALCPSVFEIGKGPKEFTFQVTMSGKETLMTKSTGLDQCVELVGEPIALTLAAAGVQLATPKPDTKSLPWSVPDTGIELVIAMEEGLPGGNFYFNVVDGDGNISNVQHGDPLNHMRRFDGGQGEKITVTLPAGATGICPHLFRGGKVLPVSLLIDSEDAVLANITDKRSCITFTTEPSAMTISAPIE